jgi:hypothetical protein
MLGQNAFKLFKTLSKINSQYDFFGDVLNGPSIFSDAIRRLYVKTFLLKTTKKVCKYILFLNIFFTRRK